MVHSNSSVLFTVSIPVWCVFAHWRGDNALIQEARKRWGRRQWVNLKSRGGRSSQFVWWLQSFMTEQPDVFNFFARQSDKLELWYDGKKDCANNIFFFTKLSNRLYDWNNFPLHYLYLHNVCFRILENALNSPSLS